ncbi:hypothetical protein WN51_06164 [Melipona quadrifasciata]|uniref:Uncharacterized protein n=1 Tax=Melipona quadrifasciata TaxID=166423 RepID=A0A0M8ZP57_9HYME|nr:hypothetical protein WN51_06164 [Melipona quadrifasciata]
MSVETFISQWKQNISRKGRNYSNVRKMFKVLKSVAVRKVCVRDPIIRSYYHHVQLHLVVQADPAIFLVTTRTLVPDKEYAGGLIEKFHVEYRFPLSYESNFFIGNKNKGESIIRVNLGIGRKQWQDVRGRGSDILISMQIAFTLRPMHFDEKIHVGPNHLFTRLPLKIKVQWGNNGAWWVAALGVQQCMLVKQCALE